MLVQPLDPSKVKKPPEHMIKSMDAKREDYENDAEQMELVCTAGGYDPDLWRTRYSQE